MSLDRIQRNKRMASFTQAQMKEMIAPLLTIGKESEDTIFPTLWQVPEGYILEKFQIEGVPVEHLLPKEKKTDRVIYHLHGGGYEFRYMDPYRDVAFQYSLIAGGAEVFSIDYNVAPSHLYPSALKESLSIYQWMLQNGYDASNIVVAGDSAGGNLALSTTLYLRDHKLPLPKAVIGVSPWVAMENTFPSRKTNYNRDLLLGEDSIVMRDLLTHPDYPGDTDLKTVYLSPVYADYTGFPKMLVQCGSYEVLLDEISEVAKNAKSSGVDITFTVYPEMSHDFQIMMPLLEETKEAWKEIKQFIEDTFSR